MRYPLHHINKKSYHKPSIKEIALDKEITLVMVTPPGEPPPAPPEWPDGGPSGSTFMFGTGAGQPASSPFGGTRPDY